MEEVKKFDKNRIEDGVVYTNQKASFIVSPKLFPADVEHALEPASPMQIFTPRLSVVRFSIAQYSPTKGSVIANIGVSEIPGIIDEYHLAVQEDLTEKSIRSNLDRLFASLKALIKKLSSFAAGDTEEEDKQERKTEDVFSRPAYQKKFIMGPYKGKSPAEVMLEAPSLKEGWEKVKSQREFLQKNADKYKANAELIEAIKDVQDLANKGMLIRPDNEAPKEELSGTERVIYEGAVKPLSSKKREDGKSFCYQIRILYDASRELPVKFVIMNGYTDVTVKENGSIRTAKVDDAAIKSYNLTKAQMSNLLSVIKYNMDIVAFYDVKKSVETVERIRKENRSAFRSQ